MTITYTWKVTGIKTKDEGVNTDAVVQAYWSKTGTDENGNQGTFSGATPFTSTTMPEGDIFVPFSELTEEMVLDWIKDVVVGQYEAHVNEQIQKDIEMRSKQIKDSTLPWDPTSPVGGTEPPAPV